MTFFSISSRTKNISAPPCHIFDKHFGCICLVKNPLYYGGFFDKFFVRKSHLSKVLQTPIMSPNGDLRIGFESAPTCHIFWQTFWLYLACRKSAIQRSIFWQVFGQKISPLKNALEPPWCPRMVLYVSRVAAVQSSLLSNGTWKLSAEVLQTIVHSTYVLSRKSGWLNPSMQNVWPVYGFLRNWTQDWLR